MDGPDHRTDDAYASDRALAEPALRDILLGAEVEGARFGRSGLVVLFEHQRGPKLRHFDEVFLRIESRWRIFAARPERFPSDESELPERSRTVQVLDLTGLTEQAIVAVELGARSPHLILTFASGQMFFLNGHHDRYESWELGTIAEAAHRYQIIATPSDRLAVCLPG